VEKERKRDNGTLLPAGGGDADPVWEERGNSAGRALVVAEGKGGDRRSLSGRAKPKGKKKGAREAPHGELHLLYPASAKRKRVLGIVGRNGGAYIEKGEGRGAKEPSGEAELGRGTGGKNCGAGPLMNFSGKWWRRKKRNRAPRRHAHLCAHLLRKEEGKGATLFRPGLGEEKKKRLGGHKSDPRPSRR